MFAIVCVHPVSAHDSLILQLLDFTLQMISLRKCCLGRFMSWHGFHPRETSRCKTQPEELHHRRLSYPHQRSPSMPLTVKANIYKSKKYLWVVLSDIIQLLIIHYCLFDNCWSKDPCRYVNPASPTSKDFFARVSWSRSSFGLGTKGKSRYWNEDSTGATS